MTLVSLGDKPKGKISKLKAKLPGPLKGLADVADNLVDSGLIMSKANEFELVDEGVSKADELVDQETQTAELGAID